MSSMLARPSGDVGGIIRDRAEPNHWFEGAAEKLRHIASLSANWDSYGSRRPDSVALHYAAVLLHHLHKRVGVEEPCITPHPNGNVCFEWDNDERLLTAEIDSKGNCHFYYERGSDEQQDVSRDFNRILQLVTKL